MPDWSGAGTTCRGSAVLRLSNFFFMTHLPGQCSEKIDLCSHVRTQSKQCTIADSFKELLTRGFKN
jgi:hypothetical protein